MAISIHIEHSGKSYDYELFSINENLVRDPWYTPKAIEGMTPIYSFLELPRTAATLACTINGIAGNIVISQYGSGTSMYYAFRFQIGSIQSGLFNEPYETASSNLYLGGTSLGYNYKDKNYVTFNGGTLFRPTNNGSAFPNKIIYEEDYGLGTLVLNKANLKADNIYKAVLALSEIGADYYTASCTRDGSTTNLFTNYVEVKIPTYPGQNPDGDDDDNGQSPSDPPIPGDGDVTSDPIPNPPPIPVFDVTNTGFVVIYNPSVTEISELAYFMWSGEFVDLIKKMFASPFEAIISLKMLFCPVTAGSPQTVWLGNVETDVTMAKVTSQFTDVDMGTLNVNEFFGSFADYAPFTKIQIYLPFIGFKDLNVDEVMNSQLHLRYRVDVYTGACIAYLTVAKTIKSTSLNSILYQFDGNCAMEIPFTSNDNSRYVSAIMNSVASSALSLANTSGFTLPTPAKGFNQKAEPGTFELGSLAPVANGMLDIMSTKPNVQRAGSLSGAVSAMAVKQPYLIIHRPIAQMPANYQHYIGIPLNLTRTLSNVKGFTVVSQVFMTSEVATDEEIVMITEMLKNGVIF